MHRDCERFIATNTWTVHPPRRDCDRFAADSLEVRPSLRSALSAAMVKESHLPCDTAACAKHVELTTARRQNAAFTCERPLQKASEACLRSCTERGSKVMASLNIALVRCNC